MKILVFTRIPPDSSHSGSGFYLADLVAYFAAEGVKVRVAWCDPPYELAARGYLRMACNGAAKSDLRAPGCLRFGSLLFRPRTFADRGKARGLHLLKRMAPWLAKLRSRPKRGSPSATSPSAPPAWEGSCTTEEARFLKKEMSAFRPDVLLVNYPWMLTGLDAIRSERPVHVCTLAHDFRPRECRVIEGSFQAEIGDPRAIEQEKNWLKASDTVVGVQDGETELFRRILPEKVVLTARQSISIRAAAHDPGAAVCAFVGSGNETNAAAARWFAQKVLPRVRLAFPTCTFHVAGRVCEILESEPPSSGMVLRGRVISLDAFYAAASVVVVPLLRGSGIKIKLLEAVSHQRAIVTTSVGLDGLEFLKPAVAVADDPELFAAAVIRLLAESTEREKQIAASKQIAETRLTPQACYGPLLAHLGATVRN